MRTLVNGTSYDYTKISVILAGTPVLEVTEINYTQDQEKENNFGTGVLPVSRGQGERNSSGSIGLAMNEVEVLRDAAPPNGSLLDLPAFDIIVVYGNPQKLVTHRLIKCEFTNDGVETSQGDTSITRSFDLVIGNIHYR